MTVNASGHNENSQVLYAQSSNAANFAWHFAGSSSSMSNSAHKRQRSKNIGKYLSNDRVQLMSHFADENTNKKIMSSFHLAANIYKSNSDEFKIKKRQGKKSNKKSVLTLPNEPSILPQTCTVSDMNESDYRDAKENTKAIKAKKRLPLQNKSKPRTTKKYEFYDRDADLCSQMSLYLDCSSTDVVKNFKGDCRRKTAGEYGFKHKSEEEAAPHDVWRVLRNINRFQFSPSPAISDESVVTRKKMKAVKKKINRGVYKTCRTEQISYISSIKVDVKSPAQVSTLSGSSSIDRVTVIANQNNFSKMCEEVQNTLEKNVPHIKAKNKEMHTKIKPNNKKISRNNCKALSYNNKSVECKANNVTEPESNKSFSRGDTLVQIKSDISVKKIGQTATQEKLRDTMYENACTEVEIQTELMDFERVDDPVSLEEENVNATRCHSKVNGTIGKVLPLALDDIVANKKNYGRFDAKLPQRQALPSRAQWSNGNILSRPNRTRTSLLSGTTKTILSPVNGVVKSKLEEVPTTPCPQTAAVTNYNSTSPSTLLEIRRALAKLKFPLVILGRDQLRGTFEVNDYDYLQFNGLDKRVWPFMLDWIEKPTTMNSSFLNKYTCNENTTRTLTQQIIKDKKSTLASVESKYNIKEHVNYKNNDQSKQNNAAKLRPILQFRDKMMKLLCKKPSERKLVDDQNIWTKYNASTSTVQSKYRINNTDAGDCKKVSVASSPITTSHVMHPPTKTAKPALAPLISASKVILNNHLLKQQEKRRTWGKGKWASDIIDNVIKKVRNGTYYSELHCETQPELAYLPYVASKEEELTTSEQQINHLKEVSVQVTMPMIIGDFIPKITIHKKKELLEKLPGFENALPSLEVKSLSPNQIVVKHCATNVILQFDVNAPHNQETHLGGTNFKRSSTACIPLMITESKTRVFKCKTRILNAILPAELCSIIPKLIKQFTDENMHMTLAATEVNPISSVTFNPMHYINAVQVPDPGNAVILETVKLPLLPRIYMSSELRRLGHGHFQKKNPLTWKRDGNDNLYIIGLNVDVHNIKSKELLPRPIIHLQEYFDPMILKQVKSEPVPSIQPQNTFSEAVNICKDVIPFSNNVMMQGVCTNVQNVPQILLSEFLKTMQQGMIWNRSSFSSIQIQCNNRVTVNISFGNHQGVGSSICIDMTHLQSFPPYTSATVSALQAIENSKRPEKRIEYIKHAEKKEFRTITTDKPLHNVLFSKSKKCRARYVKFHKKCKSTSHITQEKASTSLSKVTNLDEFFQALGAGKLLSSACDGNCGRKILSCISEMKKWITDITPRQALLVLLLTNKNDTANLVRFRPIILQGIAVNRITRVNELDMEIEVIQRENFIKLSQYRGIPSLMESTQSNNNLLEELIWIAKTTASDYKRRFDESSEILLKSLLESRKKLSPSYLRVMARYVGLGLLKIPSSIKH